MLISTFIFIIIFLIIIGILYQRYVEKHSNLFVSEEDNYNIIQKHLLKDRNLINSKLTKPIMWIHIPYEYNARNWQSFGSRSSCDLNQPYLYLTAKSIIKNCDDSFMICFVDDASFEKLIPNWNIKMNLVGEPTLSYIRMLGMTKLVYEYGGIIVPISFLCFKDLDEMYKRGTKYNKMFVGENIDNNITSTSYDFYPNLELMGANKKNFMVLELIDFMERIISSDFTSQVDFLGDFNRWCNKRIEDGKIYLVDGKYLGIKNMDDKGVVVEDLLNGDYINYYKDMYGIWIPSKMILKRTAYEWFPRMSEEQVLNGNFILAKYILIASAPDSHLGVVEPLTSKPDWVSFWKVPSGAPVWGLKPVDLGNYVPREKFSDQYIN
jgi:hypothetical protein